MTLLDCVEPAGLTIDRPHRQPRRQRANIDGTINGVSRPDCKNLNFRTIIRRTDGRRSKIGPDIDLIGRDIVTTGNDRSCAVAIKRHRADTQAAVTNVEWDLRQRDRQRSCRQRLPHNLLQLGITGRLAAIARMDRSIECARVKSGNLCPIDCNEPAAGQCSHQR
jgi:hypothetical protein